ncbi:MAG TPA: DUF1028 domain-containing protein, partial [Gaiellaceae bacterium]|nr:DUF1028 domain-containing protein [Gaiellaceae bacterium]
PWLGLLLSLTLPAVWATALPRVAAPARAADDAPGARVPAEVNTFSIVAYDPDHKEWGVAVASKYLAVGAVVPWAKAGVGAVATQAFTEPAYGPRGLKLLAAGADPAEALAALLGEDGLRDVRQVALLAADGRTAAHTGAACVPDCGHVARDGVSAQGNMLASPAVWHAAADTFQATAGSLAERLLAALDAAEEAGGDFRGREAAALLVVSGDPGAEPWRREVDLRVDDHPDPLGELRRLARIAAAYRRRRSFGERTSVEEEAELAREAGLPEDQVALTAALAAVAAGDLDEAAARLAPLGAADPRWREALERYVRLGQLPAALLDRLG